MFTLILFSSNISLLFSSDDIIKSLLLKVEKYSNFFLLLLWLTLLKSFNKFFVRRFSFLIHVLFIFSLIIFFLFSILYLIDQSSFSVLAIFSNLLILEKFNLSIFDPSLSLLYFELSILTNLLLSSNTDENGIVLSDKVSLQLDSLSLFK